MAQRVRARSQHNAENLLMPVQRTLRVKPANGKRVVLGDLGNKSTISQAASEVPTSNVCKEKPKPSLAKVKKKCNQPQNTEVQENVIVKQVKEKPLQLQRFPTSMEVMGRLPSENLCPTFSQMLLNIEDIDAGDVHDTHLCCEYVKDVYSYLREIEKKGAVKPMYLEGSPITGNMRTILIEWLVQVHSRFQMLQETLYLTVGIIDRFLQAHPVHKSKLQLVGVTAMLIASKYEEIFSPRIADFSYITDHSCTRAQIREMERCILQVLNFNLSFPIALHFLRRVAKVGDASTQLYALAKYLSELSLIDYDMVHYPASQVSAAAFALALKVLDFGEWTSTLQHYTGYTEDHLMSAMKHLANNVLRVNEGMTKHTIIKTKYASPGHMKISTIPHLKSDSVRTLSESLS
ncbi:G2/mitotic-specific cyclin-B1-like [Polypterus senegalus]|uniref:G2/mitotic-specific cyclin-B1-like n=1 Tax=Polypterus senegalus TaxID=55291 RepID=UPI001966C709|nr:G2/mitotic-specific cyclin-B1-like [Polypterus senegalus]